MDSVRDIFENMKKNAVNETINKTIFDEVKSKYNDLNTEISLLRKTNVQTNQCNVLSYIIIQVYP